MHKTFPVAGGQAIDAAEASVKVWRASYPGFTGHAYDQGM